MFECFARATVTHAVDSRAFEQLAPPSRQLCGGWRTLTRRHQATRRERRSRQASSALCGERNLRCCQPRPPLSLLRRSYLELPVAERQSLPCHAPVASSTLQFCATCVRTLASSGVGRCAVCARFFSVDAQGGVHLAEEHALCGMCQQLRPGVLPSRVGPGGPVVPLCRACVLGTRYSFVYECERCHRHQRIPHPMWLYQPAADAFGTTPWACHVGCGDYTMWRVVDATQVPAEHSPESWGRREEWLAAVREASIARREGGGGAGAGGSAASSCVLA